MIKPEELKEPKKIEIKGVNGEVYYFKIHKFDALDGDIIVNKYINYALPKIGDLEKFHAVKKGMMAWVTITIKNKDNQEIDLALSNDAFIRSHVPDLEVFNLLCAKLMEYNTSFFNLGKALNILDGLEIDQGLKGLLTVFIARLFKQYLKVEKQHLETSKNSTR